MRCPKTQSLKAAAGIALATILLAGCETAPKKTASTQDQDDSMRTYREEAEAVLGQPSQPETGRIDPAPVEVNTERAADWSIVIAAIPSERRAAADEVLRQVRSNGLRDAYLEQRSDSIVIAYGRYDGATSRQGGRDLERIQSMTVDGIRPYAFAFLAPPSGDVWRGSLPEYDLRRAKARYGGRALYTLQVGVYTRGDLGQPTPSELAEFRAAAEEAAVALRSEGETAFYYHGPRMSMVTVGIFSEQDHDPKYKPPIESESLRSARERHPNNLLNGQGLNETVRTESGRRVTRLQPSQLVEIPEG